MKKLISFPVAFLVSVLMFIITGLFITLNTGLMQPLLPARFFMVALEAVCALKFALLIIMLMPNKPALIQVAWGFLLADVLAILLCVTLSGSLTMPVSIFIVQAMFIIYHMARQGRLWIYKSDNATSIGIENELITPGI
ncbi:hypothetical protein [Mucilaginibacter celer]|uniref:Uncharacterized protein n=1 Tax=Mucilaginibacter celer TaxID=2305508 RepID=A0A494VT28_9SPHI|nr:hypothetical protein [Mucilaginibacter celer]AYL94503.1 hypothetical protein HYN43_003945 [Mucilaginibacter celer]